MLIQKECCSGCIRVTVDKKAEGNYTARLECFIILEVENFRSVEEALSYCKESIANNYAAFFYLDYFSVKERERKCDVIGRNNHCINFNAVGYHQLENQIQTWIAEEVEKL